jgi:kynureninase
MNPDEVIIEVGPREGEDIIRIEDVEEVIDIHHQELALVFWGGINYYTGQVFDMESIASKAKERKIRIGFDLAMQQEMCVCNCMIGMLILPVGAVINI